jgi:hypothetical protein
MELRARRGLTKLGSGEWVLNRIYEASSNYGQSIALPLIWLCWLLAVGSVVFNLMHMTSPGTGALIFRSIPDAVALINQYVSKRTFLDMAMRI